MKLCKLELLIPAGIVGASAGAILGAGFGYAFEGALVCAALNVWLSRRAKDERKE